MRFFTNNEKNTLLICYTIFLHLAPHIIKSIFFSLSLFELVFKFFAEGFCLEKLVKSNPNWQKIEKLYTIKATDTEMLIISALILKLLSWQKLF